MRTTIPAIALLATLAACGGASDNPVTEGPAGQDDDTTTPPVTGVTSGDNATRITGELTGITVNGGTMVVGDLPFDGPEGTGQEEYQLVGVTGITGFDVYESQDETANTNKVKYFAVYREGAYTTAGAVGTGDFQDFGPGGAQYSRDPGTPVRVGEATYAGTENYGAVRVHTGNTGTGDVFLVQGDLSLTVDFEDPSPDGAIVGAVTNRQFYRPDGTSMGSLPVITFAANQIDGDGFILNGSAGSLYDSGPNAGQQFESGEWEGAFAGPNAEEIAGVIVITGPASQDDDEEETAQEIGVFTAEGPVPSP